MLIVLLANGSARAAEPVGLPDQVLVLRSGPGTKVAIDHVPGDRAARLIITRPPPNARAALERQRGTFVRDITHLRSAGEVLELLLRLTTDAVSVEVQPLRDPMGWAMSFIPRPEPAFPELSRLVGHVPGLVLRPPRPVLIPQAPRDTPCTGNPDARAVLAQGRSSFRSELELEAHIELVREVVCRSWLTARLATLALERGQLLEPFERWAFSFEGSGRGWDLHPEARAQAALVASEVLARRDFEPEAEALLADASRYRRSDAPFRMMALANAFAGRGDHDEAETLYRSLVVRGFDPWMIHQASLARAMNALDGGDALGALAHAESARRLLQDIDALPGDLWIVGGEAAISRGELALAREHFERAARSSNPEHRALGLLRLADLEARAGRVQSALEGWAVALAVGMPCMEDHVHLRRVLALEEDHREVMDFLRGQAQFSRCGAVRMEADFARAIVHVDRGEEDLALEPALALIRPGVSRWGPARPHRAVLTQVARSAASRYERHRDPAGLVRFFEERLEPYRRVLDAETRWSIGRAYHAIGASMRGAEELLSLVTDEPKVPFRERLLVDLGEALLGAEDAYRTGLVIRHLEARHFPGQRPWQRLGLEGRYELHQDRPRKALDALTQAVALAPSGDEVERLELDRARAFLELGFVERATSSFAVAVRSAAISDSQLRAPAIRILSECARSCARRDLAALTTSISSRLGASFLTPRLKAALTRRGALDAGDELDGPSGEKVPTLWSRLDALGVGNEPRTETP